VAGRAEAAQRLERCAYMPQRDLLLPWLSALDNAALALRVAGVPRQEARARAGEHFERLGLCGFEPARPGELSGGMRQRVAFLRTLMAGRPVLLLDEPFASLDAITRGEMQSWLAAVLGPDKHTVLLVTHDVEEALYLSDRVLVLSSRPASVAERVEIPHPRAADRAAAVTSPTFTELRERALRSLAEAAR
jgi:NitT/TauT family transport system ATP-binding protein